MTANAGIAAMIHDPAGRPSTRAVRFWTLDAIVGWAFLAALQLLWMLLANLWTDPLHLAGLAVTVVAAVLH
ncbi:MAG TPA: hypothetical protein VGF80_02685, partial [Galbitalea sp.]